MRSLRTIILACIGSVLLYLLVFTLLLKKPLTLGFINEAQEIRKVYLQSKSGPKLVIIAGSNGLFSHRAEVMESILRITCLNASTIAGFALDVQIALAKRWLAPGDVVLMPLEYNTYVSSNEAIENSMANGFIINYDKGLMNEFGWHRRTCILFSFNMKYMISAALEMGLAAAGISRRFNRHNLTPQGDMRGHTSSRGKDYRQYLNSISQALPNDELLHKKFYGEVILENFLNWAEKHGIRVIGALPTTFNEKPLSNAVIAKIASIYYNQRQEFIVLPNYSQYDRNCFYDTNYHLDEFNQINHSLLIAKHLKVHKHLDFK